MDPSLAHLEKEFNELTTATDINCLRPELYEKIIAWAIHIPDVDVDKMNSFLIRFASTS